MVITSSLLYTSVVSKGCIPITESIKHTHCIYNNSICTYVHAYIIKRTYSWSSSNAVCAFEELQLYVCTISLITYVCTYVRTYAVVINAHIVDMRAWNISVVIHPQSYHERTHV